MAGGKEVCYLVGQSGEVLVCIPHHVSYPKDRAVGVVDHVKVTRLYICVCDAGEEVPSEIEMEGGRRGDKWRERAGRRNRNS